MSVPWHTVVLPLLYRLIDALPELLASTRVHWTLIATRVERADARLLQVQLRAAGIRARVRKHAHRSAFGVYVPDGDVARAKDAIQG